MDRQVWKKLRTAELNYWLEKRGVDPNKYLFHIGERKIINNAIYTTQIKTHFYLGLYKQEGSFGERIENLIDMDINNDSDYNIIDIIIDKIIVNIMNGEYDIYASRKANETNTLSSELLDILRETIKLRGTAKGGDQNEH